MSARPDALGMAAGTGLATASPKSWVTDFLLLAAIWGSSFLFMRIGTVEFGPLPTAAVRVTIAALFFCTFLYIRKSGILLQEFRFSCIIIFVNNITF